MLSLSNWVFGAVSTQPDAKMAMKLQIMLKAVASHIRYKV